MSVPDLIADVLRTKAAALVQKSPEMMSKIIDSSFVYVTSRGTRLDKAQYIDRIRGATDWRFGSQEFEDLEVLDFGTFAVATMTLHDQFIHSGGTAKNATYRSLCVFKKEGADWLWVAGQTMTPETGPRS